MSVHISLFEHDQTRITTALMRHPGVENVDDSVDVSILVVEKFSQPFSTVGVSHFQHTSQSGVDMGRQVN